MNKSLRDFFGVGQNQDFSHFRQLKPYVHFEDAKMLLQRIQGRIISESPNNDAQEYSIRVRTQSGEKKYLKNVSTTKVIEGVQFSITNFFDITGEIKASETIKNTLHAMHVGVALMEKENVIFINNRVREIFPKFPEKNHSLGNFLKLYLNDYDRRKLITTIYSDASSKLTEKETEFHIRIDEKDKWYSVRRLQDVILSKKAYYAISIEDITARKEMQYEAQRANTLFETIQEPAIIATFDGYFSKVNPAFCKLLGYTEEELLSTPYLNFIAPEDRIFTIAGNPRFLNRKPASINSENIYLTRNGERIILNWIAVPDYENKLLYATARNVSKERNYESQILESEAELKRTLRIAQLGSWSMTGLWGDENWNYETRIIFDVSTNHQNLIKNYLVEEDVARFEDKVKKCLQQSVGFDDVFKIITPKKERKFIRIIGEYQSKGNGAVKGIIQDVTAIRQAELKMIEALKMAEEAAKVKSEFLSVMSHEIRTPMNAVIGMAHILLENDPREDQIDEIQTLQFAANNLLLLINDILDFSKAEAGKIELVKEEINIHTFIESLIKTFQPMSEMRSLDLSVEMDANIPKKVNTDATRLSQMLNNIIGNAIKFTEKGSISVKVQLDKLSVKEKTAYLHICVTDTGIGIPQDKIDTIFDSFTLASSNTSRKYGGTGLGLAITKKLVDLFSGKLTIDSKEGKGTTVHLILPLSVPVESIKNAQSMEIHHLQHQDDAESIIKTKRLLVVDDNRVNLKIVGKFMKKWGVEADYVESGFDAIKKLDEGVYYHLVLMDLQMPEMDGFDTTRNIHANTNNDNQHLPVIALTAEVLGGVRQKVRDYGMLDLIAKPFNPDKLMQKIVHYAR
jgi:PAS domain S-box-containing protein